MDKYKADFDTVDVFSQDVVRDSIPEDSGMESHHLYLFVPLSPHFINTMADPSLFDKLKDYWTVLYPSASLQPLKEFIEEMDALKKKVGLEPLEPLWYQDAVVYSLYVDLFNNDFGGLTAKLDYLKDLGVNCLWLLPILDSPMRDAGFDIRDYRRIRADLSGLPPTASDAGREAVFIRFLGQAHRAGIRVIFDVAINHTSDEHPWFTQARSSRDNPYRDYYIWSDDDSRYGDARIIFEGLCTGNWQQEGDQFYFHRFFEFQPDLNYHNPQVLLEMSRNLLYWLQRGVDGFRADAIPYLWKEEGTNCENLPQTHLVVRFFRTVLDFFRPNTLLLAEACQKPKEVVKYFGAGDECHAGYHFPLMPQMFKALHMHDITPVRHTLGRSVTPAIPPGCQWFTFLRCHDELSLELVYVTEEDRKYIHDAYCRRPEWDFRLGQGISARLAEMMGRDPARIALIYSLMLTLPGTPVIYYGDEFGKLNDEEYYHEMIRKTGKNDTRFLVRGKIDWNRLEAALKDTRSYYSRVYVALRHQITTRRAHPCFGRGEMEWLKATGHDRNPMEGAAMFIRTFLNEKILVILNLTTSERWVKTPGQMLIGGKSDLLGNKIMRDEDGCVRIRPYGYLWIKLNA